MIWTGGVPHPTALQVAIVIVACFLVCVWLAGTGGDGDDDNTGGWD